MNSNTLERITPHCKILQHTTPCCRLEAPKSTKLGSTAAHCNTLRHTKLQDTATHYKTLQHTTTHCRFKVTTSTRLCSTKNSPRGASLSEVTTRAPTNTHTPTHCNAPHHSATHYNSLQHTTEMMTRAPTKTHAPTNTPECVARGELPPFCAGLQSTPVNTPVCLHTPDFPCIAGGSSLVALSEGPPATHDNSLQHATTRNNTRQHTTAHHNTLQHTAPVRAALDEGGEGTYVDMSDTSITNLLAGAFRDLPPAGTTAKLVVQAFLRGLALFIYRIVTTVWGMHVISGWAERALRGVCCGDEGVTE